MPAFRLPRLPSTVDIVTTDRKPSTLFQRWWQNILEIIEKQENRQDDLLDAIIAANTAAAAAQAAADIAITAADTAGTAATAANTAAATAQSTADAISTASSLSNSYVEGCSILGEAVGEAVIISSHTRYYGDGAFVSVAGDSVSAVYGTAYFIYYDDASRAGGAVTYHITTDLTQAVYSPSQPNRHYVGSVMMPANNLASDTIGQPALPPTVIPPA